MRQDILTKVDKFLRDKLAESDHYQKEEYKRDYTYRIEHSYRVANIALDIAKKEGLDEERTYIAALLHDIGYYVDFDSNGGYVEHGRIGAKVAREFLQGLGYSREEVEEMCYAIAVHVDDKADFEGTKTPLVLTVQDADNIDRLDVYRIYEELEWVHFKNMPIEEEIKFIEEKLARSIKLRELDFGTLTATKMWHEKMDFRIEFYKRLKNQLELSK